MSAEFAAASLVAPRVCPGCGQADLTPFAEILFAVATDCLIRCKRCGITVSVRPDCLPLLAFVERAEWERWDSNDPEASLPPTLHLRTVRAVET